MKVYKRIMTVLAAAITVTACDEGLSSIAGPTPELEPAFSSIQRDIFEAADSSGRSQCIGCHTSVGRNPAGGLNLLHDVAYDQLVNRPSTARAGAVRVVPGNPNGSYLIDKLEPGASIVGLRMPLNGPPYLTAGQITIIARWIELGALRN
jgi:hypothetical protein